MKITYIVETLAYKGGAERIISEKMNYLADLHGYEVTVVTLFQKPHETPNVYYLSDRVRQIDLQIPAHLQYKHRYPRRLWVKWQYSRMLRRKLTETITALAPDVIVGMGFASADVVCKLKTTAAKVIESHEARRFTMSNAQHTGRSPLTRPFGSLYRLLYLHTIERHADAVVALTTGDAAEWHRARRVEVIPNFSTMSVTATSLCENKKVIAVGRFEWQKGYERLLDVWETVGPKHPDWQLDIYGEGPLYTDIQQEIDSRKLSTIALHPFTPDISSKYTESSVCVLTSHYEGFSLVLLEAMRHGLPSVSFDCPHGPSSVLADGECGYVVEDGNIGLFAEKLCQLIEHPETRKAFSAAAVKRAQIFSQKDIMRQWVALFESLSQNYS